MAELRKIGAKGATPISFGEYFVGSDQFRLLFREGMNLISETAAYLDGQGREEARVLQRQAALAYAAESMRLTTRLMQAASWLLLHRAVAERELTLKQARNEKMKVKLSWYDTPLTDPPENLPERLRELARHTQRLCERILHLDMLMNGDGPLRRTDSPVARQLGVLKLALVPRD